MVSGVRGDTGWPASALAVGDKQARESPGTSRAQSGPSFYELIATQLRCQDPLEPMSESDFISQVTQFAILDELREIRSLMERVKDGDGSVVP